MAKKKVHTTETRTFASFIGIASHRIGIGMYEARSCDITVRDSGGTTFEEGSRTKTGFSKKLEMIGLLRTKLFNLSPGHRLSNDEFDPGGLSELRVCDIGSGHRCGGLPSIWFIISVL
ncbi:hypothetical protein E4U52_008402, partial [Claviceps spartinae]